MSGGAEAGALDPRAYPWRADLAADFMEGRVTAARYVPGEAAAVTRGVLSVRERPGDDARQSSELLFGESFTVYERSDGWAWGQSQTDGYVGYVRAEGLGMPGPAPTHEVAALRTPLLPAADLKTVPRDLLHMTTRVAVTASEGGWAQLGDAGWVYARHLVALGTVERDPVQVTRRYMGAPYLWGGRSSLGVDCSGLVQLALARCGRSCPRDTDQQAAGFGRPVSGGVEAAEPGDLLFTRGHVVMLSAPGFVVHANAFHMAVVEGRSDAYLGRLATLGLAVSGIRR